MPVKYYSWIARCYGEFLSLVVWSLRIRKINIGPSDVPFPFEHILNGNTTFDTKITEITVCLTYIQKSFLGPTSGNILMGNLKGVLRAFLKSVLFYWKGRIELLQIVNSENNSNRFWVKFFFTSEENLTLWNIPSQHTLEKSFVDKLPWPWILCVKLLINYIKILSAFGNHSLDAFVK